MTALHRIGFITASLLLSIGVNAATLPSECGSGNYSRLVNVKTAKELSSALSSAKAGDLIYLAAGVYKGNFVAAVSGSSSNNITICGTRSAILDGESLKSGYTLHLKAASYYKLVGFSVTRGKNGIILDSASYNVLSSLAVYNTGNEAVHLRTNSSNNLIESSEVSNAGQYTADYGEGVYIGSAKSNWCTYTNCNPDKSDNNKVIGNKIFGNAAEAIDLKEGTTNTLIQGNTFDASKITGANYADSWIDVKGNNVTIQDNIGQNSGSVMLDGYQTHVVVDGWSENIVFKNNKSAVNGKGYAINIDKSKNVTIYCDNTASGAASGLANQDCVPVPVVRDPAEETPAAGTNVNIASASAVVSSTAMREDQPISKLFDACSKDQESCMAGTNTGSVMEVVFDFKKLHNIGSVKLFGDATGNWVSKTMDIDYKVSASDSYVSVVKGLNVFQNAWITQATKGLQAQFIRVRVYGDSAKKSVQARELEIWGRPADGSAPSVPTEPSTPPVTDNPPTENDLDVIKLVSASSTYPGDKVSGVTVKYYGDQSYDSNALNKFDMFAIDSATKTPLVIYIHGGGFRSGDKADSHGDAKNYLKKGIAYATINYRLMGTAPVAGQTLLMPLNDSRRALQFIRHYASQFNIDTNKIVLIGSSAGASTALWIGLQNDMKVSNSNDPVLRQSTRVAGIGVTSTQATLDTYRWANDSEFQGMYSSGANYKTLLKYSDVFYANTGTAFSNINQVLNEPYATLRAKLDVINFMDTSDPEIYAENTAAASDTLHSYYQVDRLYAAASAKGMVGVYKTPKGTKVIPSGKTADSSLANFVYRILGK